MLLKSITLCLTCGSETLNPKYCNRSCAATHTNKQQAKRKKTKLCSDCGTLILSNRKRCSGCNQKNPIILVKNSSNNMNYGTAPYIRAHARKKYLKSGQPQQCLIDGYTLHFDVCHIKDINLYPDGTPIETINDISNLLALCKRCHWEFDHDIW